MKITVDTNVLVSATFWEGASNEIIEKVEQNEILLILSKEIIGEFVKVLDYDEIKEKIINKNLEMKRTVEKIIALSIIIESQGKLDVVKDDPNDNIILECAKAGNVDFIISNDSHLLKLKEFEGIPILTPSEFLRVLKL